MATNLDTYILLIRERIPAVTLIFMYALGLALRHGLKSFMRFIHTH